MKRLLTIGFSLLTLAACKKDNVNPTPNNTSNIVGEYTMTGTETFTSNGKSANKPLQSNATLFVMQTDKANTYYFLERYGTIEAGYFVTLSGQNFTGDEIVDECFPYDDKNRWIGYRYTSGKIASNTITYSADTPTFGIQNIQAQFPTTINSMSRKVNVIANKK